MTDHRLVDRIEGASGSVAFGTPVVDVEPPRWRAAATAARDDCDLTYFDWLSAVDETDAGVRLVLHVWSPQRREHLLLRTLLPPDALVVDSLTPVYAGASWHERETAEMFGVVFSGHPDPRPLLLPDGFQGRPLRKDFPLAARAAKPFPGAHEPGTARRRPATAPGVPAGWETPGDPAPASNAP